MKAGTVRTTRRLVAFALAAAVAAALAGVASGAPPKPTGKFSEAKAFDVSKPLSVLAQNAPAPEDENDENEVGPAIADNGFTGDGAVQSSLPATPTISGPLTSFDGLSSQTNFDLWGFRVNPPDPVGDVGPNHYVQMTNLAFAVYSKAGALLLGPAPIGALWEDFPIEDCADGAGDPVVLYDQTTDRWIMSQFTSAGPQYWDCVAISTSGDPTGTYYRYAFQTQADADLPGGTVFPDYPKYGVWSNSYVLTTRDFGDVQGYGISVYALEKNKMVNGEAKARAVQFFIDGNVPENLPLVGDGLLPPDIDGNRRPTPTDSPAPVVGTQDDDGGYGGTFDALNVWELTVHWQKNPVASLELATQLPTAPFDSNFPCAPTARDCLPQPGITNPAQYLDILSYRQRPTYRLAYRNFGKYESLVTNQSVEARPGVAGPRWYELRRTNGQYSLYQQGTYAPNDGVHRWMGSAAMDQKGDIALGYSVVNGSTVFPGIRYTGRLAGDPLGQMTLGEGTIVNGSGVQTTTNSRWGDYTSLNVDPADDCTFWYVNEYYTAASQATSAAGWLTRIASFKLPGC